MALPDAGGSDWVPEVPLGPPVKTMTPRPQVASTPPPTPSLRCNCTMELGHSCNIEYSIIFSSLAIWFSKTQMQYFCGECNSFLLLSFLDNRIFFIFYYLWYFEKQPQTLIKSYFFMTHSFLKITSLFTTSCHMTQKKYFTDALLWNSIFCFSIRFK